ncbi:MAG: glycosyltransferase family 39 protein [Deltaproteobacteria bacterium]|nr:glycosyltransferase family 39 protein [Deltaproteobacteria bacterium]
MQSVSIIVPTLNEAENIDELLLRIAAVRLLAAHDLEVLFVDDASTDGTCDLVEMNQSGLAVRVLRRTDKRGLAGAVIDGAAAAMGDVVVVMDADLSHPPEAIPDLIAAVTSGGYDMAIGSRYVPGGSIPCWSFSRRIASRLAKLLAWPFSDVKDPLSGFFAVRRDRLTQLKKDVSGFKIGLKLLSKGGDSLRAVEIPIDFHDRCQGKSNLTLIVIWEYIQQLLVLAGGNVSVTNGSRFVLVGLLGLVTDLLIFQVLYANGAALEVAHVTSFVAATITNYSLNSRWAFVSVDRTFIPPGSRRYLSFLFIALLAFFMRGGVLASLTQIGAWPPRLAITVAIVAAAGVNYLGCAFLIFPHKGFRNLSDTRWRLLALGVVGYTLMLRLVYLGVPELLQEEAYYWNYAQHLDIGYLDHPPAVAWIIHLGTMVFGDTEFGIRIGAYGCWLITALFCFKLTHRIFNKWTALRALLLIAVLPIFFGLGLVMIPDAPLMACWSGALYFLYRALIDGDRNAWIGAGICLGLGLLSKYTIALLGPAAIIFLILDRRSRGWFVKPEPYLSVFIALTLFLPVIIWNFHNEWASFVYQGPRRILRGLNFSLHELIGSMLVLLTPTGLLAAISIIFSKKVRLPTFPSAVTISKYRSHTFALVFLLVPLSVFMVFSLSKEVKLHWTGPLWLAVIPFMAHYMGGGGAVPKISAASRRLFRFVQRMWPATIAASLLIYGAALHYVTLGLPGLPYPDNFFLAGFRDLGQQIEQVENDIELATGVEPLVVGMDKYRTASLLAFYRPRPRAQMNESLERESVLHTAGCHLFGENSLMYQYWFPEKVHDKSVMILVSPRRDKLTTERILSRVKEMGNIQEITLHKNGRSVGKYYYVVVNGDNDRKNPFGNLSPSIVSFRKEGASCEEIALGKHKKFLMRNQLS